MGTWFIFTRAKIPILNNGICFTILSTDWSMWTTGTLTQITKTFPKVSMPSSTIPTIVQRFWRTSPPIPRKAICGGCTTIPIRTIPQHCTSLGATNRVAATVWITSYCIIIRQIIWRRFSIIAWQNVKNGTGSRVTPHLFTNYSDCPNASSLQENTLLTDHAQIT